MAFVLRLEWGFSVSAWWTHRKREYKCSRLMSLLLREGVGSAVDLKSLQQGKGQSINAPVAQLQYFPAGHGEHSSDEVRAVDPVWVPGGHGYWSLVMVPFGQ